MGADTVCRFWTHARRRARRFCVGALVPIDGSLQAWFEERGSTCTLIVFIDHATGHLIGLRFTPAKTTPGAYGDAGRLATRAWSTGHLYSDKHSIVRVNRPDQKESRTLTSTAGRGPTQDA